jgi:hypothetical protein
MKMKLFNALLIAAIVALSPMVTGCDSMPKSPQARAYIIMADTWAGVKAGMRIYTDAYARGDISEERREKIDNQYVKFRLAFLGALELAQFDYDAVTPESVTVLSSELLALITEATE